MSRHSAFPASLYRFQIHRDSRLYDRASKRDDWQYEDGIEVNADGLVHPNITADCMPMPLHVLYLLTYLVSNGALFMPNTHYMQEVTRISNDHYLEDVESGDPAAEAHYLCMPQGTAIPKSLILFRERTSRFSLQPAHPISLDDLNKILTHFYLEFGRTFNPDAWLEMNYHEAFVDDQEEWMRH
ncbi:hypothetical protein N7517_009911 [Penicillium concentricum]|uniref:Tse2 ADP-ribosyltransferase toxin domain-containing protein n=1 Tax=Penicillium concentricum TaxID=293559 RepID=A0A9W9RJI7_9EURO|nr:uncharacterized protein N7517_009911 [Penicillium concentricum]KAJ5360720.1 hypothetical protein N7517_009911 [Penicillium concentricum]